MLGPVDRERAGERRDRSLARRVGGLRRKRDERRLGGDVDDCPAGLAQQGPKAWQAWSVPSTLISKFLLKSSTESSSTGLFSVSTPAALISTSSLSRLPASASSAARSVTSTGGSPARSATWTVAPARREQPAARLADPRGTARDDSDSTVETVHVSATLTW